jgi:hypothetical protein
MNSADSKPSLLMMEECFTAGDDGFLTEFAKVSSAKVLQDYLQKLTIDTRPWARRMLLSFLSLKTHVTGQQFFFKRLFKHAESTRDHEMMAAFLVTLDRIVRRSRISRSWWNRQLRMMTVEESLFAAPNAVPLPAQTSFVRHKKTRRLFSQKTRAYLRRRVWRYFRWMSYRDPQMYVMTLSKALCQYRDEDFTAGENIIDNWSLMHVCYFDSDVLTFTGSHCNLLKGQSLSSLNAAPYRADNWRTDDALQHLVEIVTLAQSALVRIWAMELLQKDHRGRFGAIPFAQIARMLSSDDQRVQQFGSEIVRQHPELSRLTVSTWLDLLKSTHPLMLQTVCQLMIQHVSIARLSNDQIIQLANAAATPVAELGFQFLTQRHAERPLTAAELVTLSGAQCEAVAEPLAIWGLSQLNRESMYSTDGIIEFFDSANESSRSAAMSWLESPESLGHNDAVLWSRLVETPYDDVRLRLIRSLQNRVRDAADDSASLNANSLTSLWCSVLLGVHRGGREKLLAMDQIRLAIQKNPELADSLLPVLSVAARSLRPPERRRALASFAALLQKTPVLSTAMEQHIPELTLVDT